MRQQPAAAGRDHDPAQGGDHRAAHAPGAHGGEVQRHAGAEADERRADIGDGAGGDRDDRRIAREGARERIRREADRHADGGGERQR